MRVVVTGLVKDACKLVHHLVDAQAHVVSVAASDLLESLAAYEQDSVIWFYRAPWMVPELPHEDPQRVNGAGWLEQWLTVHRTLLRRRRVLGARLLLVNADVVEVTALLDALSLPRVASSTKGDESAAAGGGFNPGTCLASDFETALPEYCDVFEALEALAWRAGTGAVPGLRSLQGCSEQSVLRAFQLMVDGQVASGLKAGLFEARDRLALLEAELDEQRAESELLKLQLGHLQEEVDLMHAQRRRQAAAGTARPAGGEEQRSRVGAELQPQSERAADAQTPARADALVAENLRLKQALAALEDAHRQATAGPVVREQDRAQGHAAQEQLAGVFKTREEELARARADRDMALEASRQELEQRQALLDDVQMDNEMLQLQLQQLQDEMERAFQEKRQMQALLRQSEHVLHRARKFVSRLTPSEPAPEVPAQTMAAEAVEAESV